MEAIPNQLLQENPDLTVAYEFYFNFGGRSLYVFSDGEDWSNGNGDFPVNGNIEQLLMKINE